MSRRAEVIIDVKTEISQVKQSAQQMEKIFSSLNLSPTLQKTVNSTFSELTKNIRNFEVAASKSTNSLSDFNKIQRNLEKVNDSFTKLKLIQKDLGDSDLKKLLPDDVIDKYKKLEDMLKRVNNLQAKDNSKAIKTATNKYEEQQRKVTQLEGKIKGLNKENASLTASLGKKGAKKTGLYAELENAEKKAEELGQKLSEVQKPSGSGKGRYQVLNAQYKAAQTEVNRLTKTIGENEDTIRSNRAEVKKYKEELNSGNSILVDLKQKLDQLSASDVDSGALTKLREDLAQLKGVKLDDIPKDLNGIKSALKDSLSSTQNIDTIKQIFQQLGYSAEEVEKYLGGVNEKLQETGSKASYLAQVNSEMDQFKSRLTYFFSAMNGFQLFKNAVRSAYNSIKELDAAMTEMAVVTEYSVGDLWKQMPQYAANANKLGTSTLDVYKSMVLYTQQGLKMAEATQLSNETLKMARIAGLDGAEATDLMTAA